MTDTPSEEANPGGSRIDIRRLTKRYNLEAVANNVNANVAPGEFFSLLGPSGSGKTTTLMIIAGFVATDGGSILVNGKDVVDQSPQQRGFGVVFQNYAIFPHLSVWENIAFPLKVRRLPRDEIKRRVLWAIDLVRLGGFAQRFARQLSGGQQQRVALARAIVFHPKVLLMDEPLGALDKNLRYQMQTEIKDIQRRLGMTVIYVTHDQEEAMNMSDRLAIMNRGSVEQIGSPSEVYDRPANSFVARFLGEANLIEGTVIGSDHNATTVRLSDGAHLRGTASAEPAATGSVVSLFVRPEKLSILPPAKAQAPRTDENRVLGRVRRIAFLGSTIRYKVDVGQPADITVDVKNVGSQPPVSAGDWAALSWSCADCLLLPL
jgi:spermidine/putrescine ABC transporter ATP-binding subunit